MEEQKNLELEIEGIKSEYNLLATTMNLNQQNILNKLNELVAEFKEIKKYMETGLDSRIDERIQLNEGKKAISQRKFLWTTILSSGGLSAVISLLFKFIK